jgi:hypothetical protein
MNGIGHPFCDSEGGAEKATPPYPSLTVASKVSKVSLLPPHSNTVLSFAKRMCSYPTPPVRENETRSSVKAEPGNLAPWGLKGSG